MAGASAFYLDGSRDGRLHLQHGPIDLVIGVDGCVSDRQSAFEAAHARFQTVLDELVSELPLLKAPAGKDGLMPKGVIACRMVAAVRPFADRYFITPMAAVAGSVADEILSSMLAIFPVEQRPSRIYVNNGGDIALHLDAGSSFHVGLAREDGVSLGGLTVRAEDQSRGVATSGRGGRSLSLGIADSVTAVAANAASADAVATLIANAVDLPGHPAIRRARACDLIDDSDLGEQLVVNGCGSLCADEVGQALDAGLSVAEDFAALGLVHRASLTLQSEMRLLAPAGAAPHPYSLSTHPSEHCLNV